MLFTKNLEDIAYSNINYIPAGTQPDGRLLYKKLDPNLNDVILLSNTTQGGTWTGAFKVERPFKNGFYASGVVLLQPRDVDQRRHVERRGLELVRTRRSASTSTTPPLTTSNFQVGTACNLTASDADSAREGADAARVVLLQRPDGPAVRRAVQRRRERRRAHEQRHRVRPAPTPSQVNVTNGTYAQLRRFMSGDCASQNNRGTDCRPATPARRRGPTDLDFRYAVDIPTGGHTNAELTMDIFNLLNLLNKDWGWAVLSELQQPARSSATAASRNR